MAPQKLVASLSSDQLGSQLDQQLSTTQSIAAAQMEPASDPYMATYVQRQSLNTYNRLYKGVIKMALPHLNSYRVALSGLMGEWPCFAVHGDCNNSLIGPRDTSMLQPLTEVLVHLPENANEGIILGVLSEIVTDGNVVFSDAVVQGSHVGLRHDGHYEQYVTTTSDKGGATDHSHHRPIDQTSMDWGRMVETGLCFHLDPMMVMMRVNETCGVFGFYQDGALRVAGARLDIWSDSHTMEYRDDDGECSTYMGEVMYPWEAKGVFEEGKEVHKVIEDKDVLFKKPFSKLEPKEMDQQAFHRYEEYGGYLGQGHIRQVAAPPKDVELYRYSSEKPVPGVFREHIGPDGSYGLASATEISFAKRSVIPIPKRQRLQEDGTDDGDNPKNYKASGVYGEDGDGYEHKVGEIVAPEKDPQMTKLAALVDLHTHKFNWKALTAFAYHSGDFKLPEEEDLVETVGKNQMKPDYSELAEKTWMPLPEPKKLKIDERYKEISLYELMSMITMTNDGAIKITAGQGESITLGGGNILIDCPGSIILRPGKSFVAMAGDDAILRARNSVDLTAGNKDVRIKAEKNMQLLAGNGGSGGMLIENRSTGKSHDYPAEGGENVKGNGIILKAPKSQIATLSSELYLRTGGDKELGSGPIVVDAGKSGEIRMLAGSQYRFTEQTYVDSFGVKNVRAANVFTESNTLFNGYLFTKSGMITKGFITAEQGITSASGHFSSTQGGDVGKLPSAASAKAAISAADAALKAGKDAGRRTYEKIDSEFYTDSKIGNEETIKKISVGLRNEQQYGTKTDFVMPQCYWQQLGGDGGGVVTWDEPVVNYQGGSVKTMPWPGYEAWSNEDTLLVMPTESLKMFDLAKGVGKPRNVHDEESPYAKGELGEPKREKPKTAYKVIDSKE